MESWIMHIPVPCFFVDQRSAGPAISIEEQFTAAISLFVNILMGQKRPGQRFAFQAARSDQTELE